MSRVSYSEMSDNKINRQVFECLFGDIGEDKDMLLIWQQSKFQPCSSWNDAGPIIADLQIDLGFNGSFATARKDDCFFSSKNPLRAAMIVFLMMQEKK